MSDFKDDLATVQVRMGYLMSSTFSDHLIFRNAVSVNYRRLHNVIITGCLLFAV